MQVWHSTTCHSQRNEMEFSRHIIFNRLPFITNFICRQDTARDASIKSSTVVVRGPNSCTEKLSDWWRCHFWTKHKVLILTKP